MLAGQINALFVQARKEIEILKVAALALLENPGDAKGLFDSKRYTTTKNYIYYTPIDDGQCEVWASGHIPIGGSERKRIKMFEHLCPDLQNIYNRSNFVDNIYLTTYDSIVMGYPYADMHAYMQSGLDLTKVWVTYWAAAEDANPKKKTLWVNPYIDAVGRGYMTSIITPVYYNNFLEGTLGIDITVDLISDKFIALSQKNLMIVTGRTIPVAINKNSFNILRMKGLEKYNYLKKEPENRSISSSLMMTKNSSKDIQAIAAWITGPKKEIDLMIFGEEYSLIKEKIPEIGWFLIELKKN
ncbi:MAG: cache domain-containing protein [Desulfobacula sp.]|nr:cache domain-containing protein [Desulfobacula sp.]